VAHLVRFCTGDLTLLYPMITCPCGTRLYVYQGERKVLCSVCGSHVDVPVWVAPPSQGFRRVCDKALGTSTPKTDARPRPWAPVKRSAIALGLTLVVVLIGPNIPSMQRDGHVGLEMLFLTIAVVAVVGMAVLLICGTPVTAGASTDASAQEGVAGDHVIAAVTAAIVQFHPPSAPGHRRVPDIAPAHSRAGDG
jgi:Na+-transporting methylmalonyl-CoA/oxaloacetate decarboxylase gamma subunit